MSKNLFKRLIKLASQPVSEEPEKSKSSDGCIEKQTRQHKTEDTSEKRNDKSR